MQSMTGYGKGVAERDGKRITVEMKSVNHRFLDLMVKTHKGLGVCEDVVRRAVQKQFARGHIEAYVSAEDTEGRAEDLCFDRQMATDYLSLARELQEMGFANDMSVSVMIRTPDFLKKQSEEPNDELLVGLAAEAAEAAATALKQMREREGAMILCDFQARVGVLGELLAVVQQRAADAPAEYRARLAERIATALNGVAVDEARLINEVAFYTDKINVDEEITRLFAHLKHYEALLAEQGAIGKKLDFLTQEVNREVNTIGSKCSDINITEIVLQLKNEVEKIREQIQNIE